ncbi:MAG: hypothetical protein GTO41_12230 [Burkholderiales bacterium]|nr:hypothetical protein [Burkholderiales bacterium]
MQRYRSQLVLCLLLSVLSAASVAAGEYYVRSNKTVFAPPPPDQASVYFARLGEPASWKEADALFIDDQPLGLLPSNAFLVATVKPGKRFVWWTTFLSHNSEWLTFKPGRAYLLLSTSRHGYWYLDDPGRIVEVVNETRLTQARTTASGLALLQEHSAKKYQRLQRRNQRKDGQPLSETEQAAGTVLPLVTNGVDYQRKLGRFKEPRFWGRFGGLDVDGKRLRWRSRQEEVEIAIKDIRAISFAGLSIREHIVWLRVRYGAPNALSEAFFHSPVEDGFFWSHNRKFAALADAMERNGRRLSIGLSAAR